MQILQSIRWINVKSVTIKKTELGLEGLEYSLVKNLEDKKKSKLGSENMW